MVPGGLPPVADVRLSVHERTIMADNPNEPTLYRDESLQEAGWKKPTKRPNAKERPAGLPRKPTSRPVPTASKEQK